jgi:cobyrinic acid a,c-diamide synthase
MAHVYSGKPLLAECGGMMACFDSLDSHPMFGLLSGVVRMQKRLAGLGLLSADLPEGRLGGHTFHFSVTETPLASIAQAVTSTGHGGEAIYRHRRLTASSMHFYFPANPFTAARLFLP